MTLCGLAWFAVFLSMASSRRPEDFQRMVIDEDKLFSAFLYPGKAISFFYLLQQDEVATLSFTVTPCTAPVAWDIAVRSSNDTGKVEEKDGAVKERADQRARTMVVSPAFRGLYTVRLSVEQETWVQLYVTYAGNPRHLRPTSQLRYLSRTPRGQLFLKWQQTTVDPDDTEYVVVVHKGAEATESLCQASGELKGVDRPQEWAPPPGLPLLARPRPRRDMIMERTGKKTSWTVRGLVPREHYRIEVFALNTNTNFSYKYAAASDVVYRRPRPARLPDGRQVLAELRRSEPTATFVYKMRESGSGALEVGVTACGSGGTVLAELRQRGSALGDKATITGHGVLVVSSPPQGAVFLLRLRMFPLTRSTQVQVIATTKSLDEPGLPELAVVHEYKGLRGCRQLTLGWIPVPGEALYCITATQIRRHQPFHRLPDQCSVEQALNSLAYSVLQCTQVLPKENQTVITESITNLKPGKQYDIQVSVKKGNSKVLSYELIRVRTKSSCK